MQFKIYIAMYAERKKTISVGTVICPELLMGNCVSLFALIG